jgi:predicted nucleotidyltransferase
LNFEEVARLVAAWASSKSQIAKVQFYGSRVKRTHREDSDLDLAITLMPNLDESGGLATWCRYSDEWSAELSKALPYQVHAEWEAGEETPTILKGLSEASYLVYEKES